MLGMLIAAAFAATPQAAWTDYDDANTQLTASYSVLRAHLNQDEWISLRDEERRWISARNARCGLEAKNACATAMTEKRARELENRIAAASLSKFNDAGLLALERKVNEACKGPGQDGDGVICVRRDKIVRELESRGWCWGPDSAPGEYARRWMRASAACRVPRG